MRVGDRPNRPLRGFEMSGADDQGDHFCNGMALESSRTPC